MNITDKEQLIKISEMHDMVLKADHIAIITHMNPDGDALGSSLGVMGWLDMLDKHAEIFTSDRHAATLDFIFSEEDKQRLHSFDEDKEFCIKYIGESDLIICLDFNSLSRSGMIEDYLAASKAKKIIIDHHVNPEQEQFDICFSKTDISSASELVYQILMQMPETKGDASNLPHNSARGLMTGMTTDTNNFANSTYPSTLRMASELLEAGVNRDEIVSHINNEYREERLRLMGLLLKDELTILPNGVAYMILDRDTMNHFNIMEGETEGFVNLPLAAKKVKMSIFLKEDEHKYRFSARSKKGTSARKLAETYFYGGGHELASGGRLPFEKASNKKEAKAYIEMVCNEFMKQYE